MERLKLSLQTREIINPVAQSRNRPSDVVRLTTSNLPELNWTSAAAPLPSTAFNVDDLLDILSPSSKAMTTAASSAAAQQQVDVASSLPAYQPKYTLSGRENQEKHALFFNSSSNTVALPSSSSHPLPSSAGNNSVMPRYPQPVAASTVVPPHLRIPPPGMLSPEDMQRLHLGPSAGPSLGPQEIEVGTAEGTPQSMACTLTSMGHIDKKDGTAPTIG